MNKMTKLEDLIAYARKIAANDYSTSGFSFQEELDLLVSQAKLEHLLTIVKSGTYDTGIIIQDLSAAVSEVIKRST